MATSRRTATNENVSTYGAGGQGRDYTVLATWEAATDIDLVTATQSEVLECYDDAATFNDRISMAGATTNTSYYRIIRPAGTIGTGNWEGHDGTPNNGFHLNYTVGSLTVLDVGEQYSGFQDLIVTLTNPNAANTIAVVADGGDNLLVGIIGVNMTSANNTARGIRLETNAIAVNCIVINCDTWGFEFNSGNSYFYNCNANDNGGTGFIDGGGTGILKNCLGDGSGNEDFDSGGAYSSTNNNASGDANAPGTSARINQTFTFVNAGNNDYHLASNDAGAKTFGADLSADGTFAFDDDIDGETRS